MGFEISKMTDAKMQSWATKCDANGDGKIDNNELSIFYQGKGSMTDHPVTIHVTIDGVKFEPDQIEKISQNPNNQQENNVLFKNGIEVSYQKGSEGSMGARVIDGNSVKGDTRFNSTSVNDLSITGVEGVSIWGTNKSDSINLYNASFKHIDASRGKDHVHMQDCTGLADGNGRTHVIAEGISITGSKNFSATSGTPNLPVKDYVAELLTMKKRAGKIDERMEKYEFPKNTNFEIN